VCGRKRKEIKGERVGGTRVVREESVPDVYNTHY
jgi:hypothetical protein